jgi:SAM-dependent methyltransferase
MTADLLDADVDVSVGQIDAEAVRRYFDGVASVADAASFMAHERDLPAGAVAYRLARERKAIADWLDGVSPGARALDVGCGAGAWTEVLAERFASVIAVDQSPAMCSAASRRLAGRSGVTVSRGDVRQGLPDGPFDLAFLGGLCMYLSDPDALTLLKALRLRLEPGGVAVLRESTVRARTRRVEGRYQAIYRSVAHYRELFSAAGFSDVSVRRNDGYTAMSVAADLVVARRRLLPLSARGARLAGALTWWGLRGCAPISFGAMPRLLDRLDVEWPPLQNHFFRIAAGG